jgi:hypothetical protein
MSIPPGSLLISYDFSDPACYPGTGNTVFDLSGNTINAVKQSAVTFNSDGNASSFIFNNAYPNTYIEASFNPASKTVWTFNAWIFPTSDIYGGIIFAGDTGNGSGPYIAFNAAAPSTVGQFLSSNGFGTGTIYPATIYPKNNWYMISYSSDGTTLKLYINATQVGSASASGVALPVGSIPFRLGGNVDTANTYIGKIAIAEFYGTAVSSGDITTLYNDTKDRFVEPIISYDFSDAACYPGSGSTVFDLAGSLDLPIDGATFGGTGQSKYFEFSGGSSYIGKTGVTGLGTSFSISIWSQSSSSAIQVLFFAGTDPPASSAPAFYYNLPTSGSISGSFNYGTGLIIEPFAINTWENYIYTADGTTAKLYKNGVLEGSVSQGAGNWPTGLFYLGYPTDALIGKIATFDVYNVALNSGEVTDIYDNTENRFFPAPPPAPGGIVGGRQLSQGFNG